MLETTYEKLYILFKGDFLDYYYLFAHLRISSLSVSHSRSESANLSWGPGLLEGGIILVARFATWLIDIKMWTEELKCKHKNSLK